MNFYLQFKSSTFKSWLLEIEYLLLKPLRSSWLAGLIMVWLFRMTAHGTLVFTPNKLDFGEKGTQIPARVPVVKAPQGYLVLLSIALS